MAAATTGAAAAGSRLKSLKRPLEEALYVPKVQDKTALLVDVLRER